MSEFMNFDELPSEVQATLRANMDRHHMAAQSLGHDINRFFGELTADQLLSLRTIFRVVTNVPADAGFQLISHFDGIAVGTLTHKFNVCPTCAVDHDKEMFDNNGEQSEVSPDDKQMTLDEALESNITSTDEAFILLFKKFNVYPTAGNLSKPFDKSTPVTCANCKQDYISLEDRMVRPPGHENCDGCIQKSKWG